MNLAQEINEQIQENFEELNEAQANYGGVFVAQIEEATGLNLEVEVDEGTIAFTIRVELGALQKISPQEVYEILVDCLEAQGIDVFLEFSDWEEALV